MSKLTKKDKLDIYSLHKQGETLSSLSKRFCLNKSNIEYFIALIDRHGVQIMNKTKNRKYSIDFKLMLINQVLLEKQSIRSVSLQYGLSNIGILANWIRSFREKNGIIVEKTRGRKSTMKKLKKPYAQMTDAEKVKYLERKNELLEIENIYLKKLDALIRAEKAQKKQKEM